MIALDLSDFSSTIVSSCDNTPETYPSDPKPHYTRPPLALEVSPPPQPTLPKTNDIDLNIDMASILAKANVPVPFSIDIVFFFKYLQNSRYCDVLECHSHRNHIGDDTS
jgi:hypothetical protein